jgi:tetratricopeptide (TPR) repeat protein
LTRGNGIAGAAGRARPRGRASLVAGLAAGAVLAGGPARAGLDPSEEARAAFSLLHQGRFEAAAAAAARLSATRPADPEGPMLEALTAWWRLLDDPKDRALLSRLDERLGETVRRGEAMAAGADPLRGKVLAGTALVLSAHTRAAARRYFAAGSAARQGHAHLEGAFKDSPEAADAGFALGAYKYYAAKLPFLVRALRVFVFIPGGNREEGLRALAAAAEKGRFFRCESLLLLTHIHSAEEEDGDVREALAHLAKARALEPGSPLFAAVEARLLFSLGRLAAAEAAAREAIRLSEVLPGTAPQIAAMARLRLALTLYYQYRPREALAELSPLLSEEAELLGDAPATVRALHGRLAADLGISEAASAAAGPPASTGGAPVIPPRLVSAAPVPGHPEAAAAVERLRAGSADVAAAELASVAAREPADAVVRYHLARAYQESGRRADGVAELRRVLADGARIPRTLQGWALIRLGAAMEAEGNRPEAERSYRKAAELRGFVFSRAARDRLKHPADPVPPEG